MQSVSFGIWTRVAVSISYDDNHYTTRNSFLKNLTLVLANHILPSRSFFKAGKANTGASLLLSICTEHLLKQILKNSWMHPKSKYWHLIDYIITQRDLPDFQNTRARRKANCNTDYVITKSIVKLQMRQRMRKNKMPIRKLATNTININRIRDYLQASKNDRQAEIPASTVEEKWITSKLCKRYPKRNSPVQ